MGDEIEVLSGRPLAVELGEVGQHATADPGTWKCRPGRLDDLPPGRHAFRQRRAGRVRLEVGSRGHDDGCRTQICGLDCGGCASDLGGWALAAGNDDLEHHLGADPLRQLPVARQGLLPTRLAQVDPAVEMLRRGLPHDVGDRKSELDVLRQHAEAKTRHRPGLAAQSERDRRPFARRARQPAREAEGDGMADLGAARDRVRPGQRERARVGLERRVRPVAMILGLPGIALHAQRRADTRYRLVSHCSDVEKRLSGIDQLRRLGALDRAVDMLDLHGPAGHACERVQNDEAGSAGQKVLLRPRDGCAADRAVGRAPKLGVPGQIAIRGAGQRIEGHDEAATALVDAQIADRGRAGAPDAVADQKRDGANHLRVADLDPAQLTVLEGCRDGAGNQPSLLGHRLVGAEQLDRAFDHVGLRGSISLLPHRARCRAPDSVGTPRPRRIPATCRAPTSPRSSPRTSTGSRSTG